ncbi:MAG: UDP-2,3-diacylglucosamine diphosphatase [Burkholderiales bacterium]|nr:UDP-2,3-diacylglucosamine diphosphatase [Burkholderiales bacterium]
MKIVLISDLHLAPETLSANNKFAQLMQQWQHEIDALYILGDFFDSWCGDDDDNLFIQQIKNIFTNFTKHKPIYFMVGNHDFVLGKRFAQATGVEIIADETVVKIADNLILLSHGDRFCSLDKGHQKLRFFLYNRFILSLLTKIPLSWRYKIKEKLKKKSEAVYNAKPQETYLVVNKTILKFANKYGANIVIHGHTHNPGKYQVASPEKNIVRYEIPDWADRDPGGYILINNNNIDIMYA